MESNFEIRILGEYGRRYKQLITMQQKARKLRDLGMIKESNGIQELFELLLNEIEAYYRKYRAILVKYGVLPKPPLMIDDLTAAEIREATA